MIYFTVAPCISLLPCVSPTKHPSTTCKPGNGKEAHEFCIWRQTVPALCETSQDAGQFLCCQTWLAFPKGRLITQLSVQWGEGSSSKWWEMGKRLFSWLWGVFTVDTEDYPGTKVALRAYVVCAQLVLRYYRLVLLLLWTIEGFIAALCAKCLHGFFFFPSSRSRQIFSIKFLKERCQDKDVWTFTSPCLMLTFKVH